MEERRRDLSEEALPKVEIHLFVTIQKHDRTKPIVFSKSNIERIILRSYYDNVISISVQITFVKLELVVQESSFSMPAQSISEPSNSICSS